MQHPTKHILIKKYELEPCNEKLHNPDNPWECSLSFPMILNFNQKELCDKFSQINNLQSKPPVDLKTIKNKSGIVTHTFHPNTQDTEANRFLRSVLAQST